MGKRRSVGDPVSTGADDPVGHCNDLGSETEKILIRRTVDVTDCRYAVLVQTHDVYGEPLCNNRPPVRHVHATPMTGVIARSTGDEPDTFPQRRTDPYGRVITNIDQPLDVLLSPICRRKDEAMK